MEAKNEYMLLKSDVIGTLETTLMAYQTLVEMTQDRLKHEKAVMRLLVRQEAGLLSPDEQAQLEELRRVPTSKATSLN